MTDNAAWAELWSYMRRYRPSAAGSCVALPEHSSDKMAKFRHKCGNGQNDVDLTTGGQTWEDANMFRHEKN